MDGPAAVFVESDCELSSSTRRVGIYEADAIHASFCGRGTLELGFANCRTVECSDQYTGLGFVADENTEYFIRIGSIDFDNDTGRVMVFQDLPPPPPAAR